MKPVELSTVGDWLRAEIEKQPYWFQQIELAPGLVTPGWSNPKVEKLPYFGLPDDMKNMRVLDIGCSEGFFSFEAERRGAKEVIAIDSSPDSINRFNLCRTALNSKVNAYLATVYDLNTRVFGTFDLVMFFGVLYHLRHPLLALQKIYDVLSGALLFQSAHFEDASLDAIAMAKFYPFGIASGSADKQLHDCSVFWIPNATCVRDMLHHVGFCNIEMLSKKAGIVFRAEAPQRSSGTPPDQSKVPGA